jgi:hypothetical protein
MRLSSKSLVLSLLVLLLIPSVSLVKQANAQSIPKPSIPEVTVEFVDRSYDVPATYTNTTDPFTGQQVTEKHGGYRVWNETIDVTVKNQQYTPIDLGNGTTITLYYSVRTKGHFVDWNDTLNGYVFKRIASSTSEYTVITFILRSFVSGGGYYASANVNPDELPDIQPEDLQIPQGATEDFQVKAEIGYLYPVYSGHLLEPPTWVFASFAESDWSDIQTLTVPYYVPTSTPTTPEFSAITLVPLFAVLTFTATLLKKKRFYKSL